MNSINKKGRNLKFTLKVIISMLFLFLIFISTVFLFSGFTYDNESEIWDEEWTIQVKAETYNEQSISKFNMDSVNPGETVTLTNTIPDTFGKRAISVSFFTYQSKVDAYVDGYLFYKFGQEDYTAGNFVATQNNVIDLGDDNVGRELKIEITAANYYSYKFVEKVIIAPNAQLSSYLIHSRFVSIFSGLFLLSFGLVTIVLALIFLLEQNEWTNTFVIGIFIMLLGVWIECNSRAIFVINNDASLDTTIEYVTFYLFPLPLTLYFRSFAKKNKVDESIWKGILFVQIIGFITSMILHFSKVLFFPEMLPYWHIFYLIYAVFLAYLMLKRFLKKEADRYDKVLFLGFLIFAISILIGIVASEFSPTNIGVPLTSTIVLPLASVVLVLFISASYFSRIIDYLYQKGEYDSLTHLAYEDFLTDIPNRANAVKYMEEFNDKNKKIAVMSCDVNDLKKVNDQFGHIVGDELLIDFAGILKDTFGKKGCFVARMGGDEFIVIFYGIPREKINEQIANFKKNIRDFNDEEEKVYNISICYGIAFRKKDENINALDLYKISDENMYEMKQQYHKSHPRYTFNEENCYIGSK